MRFDEYAAKGKSFVAEVAKELKTEDTDRAGRLLRCVLRALRNRLTIEESFQFLSQLPMAIKAVYVDGWRVRMNPSKIRHIEDFRTEVMKEDDFAAIKDFYYEGAVDDAIKAVFKVLSYHVSAGEISHVLSALPAELRAELESE
ncbi:MAG: DUF2267 domain-containing protein [Bacteroidia bacterium]|nr:DUF2267 domain-containing protein [Bacteroidia bacterium]